MATAALNWYGTFEHLARSFHVVAPNLRGHGRRGQAAPVPPFSLEGCADDVASFVTGLGLDRPLAVGYSMGGAVAQLLARRHGGVVGGVVLCATAASFADRHKLRPTVHAAGRLGVKAARRWPGTAARLLTWRVAVHDRDVSRQPGGRHAQPDWALAERSLSDLASFIEAGATLRAFDSREWLPRLQVPAAVVVTARDRVVAPWRQHALAALLGAREYELDAGHDAVVAVPDQFVATLQEACLELAGRRPPQPA